MTRRDGRLLVVSGTPALTQNVVWAAGHAGRRCIVLADHPSEEWRWLPHVVETIFVSREELISQSDSLVRRILFRLRNGDISSIVPADTHANRLLHRSPELIENEIHPFPAPGRELFEQLYDKGRFANLLVAHELPTPCTVLARDPSEAIAANVNYPVIIKPAQGEDSVGVVVFDSPDSLVSQLSVRKDAIDFPIVVQEFIPGHDIDISLLSDNGEVVSWTIQQRQGAVMRFVDDSDVLRIGTELVNVTRYHGLLHLDLRRDERDGRLMFVDANPRFWGTQYYSLWMGVNFVEQALMLETGCPTDRPFAPVRGDCPYLAVTRRSLPRLLMGGRTPPRDLTPAQRRSWRYHHRWGNGGWRLWVNEVSRRSRRNKAD
jgi:hypothetical protein